MSINLEEVRNEIIELENKVALMIEEVHNLNNNVADVKERDIILCKLQLNIGKDTRRLNSLRELI